MLWVDTRLSGLSFGRGRYQRKLELLKLPQHRFRQDVARIVNRLGRKGNWGATRIGENEVGIRPSEDEDEEMNEVE